MKKYLLMVFLCITTIVFSTTIYDVQFTTVPGPDNTYPSTYEGQTVTVTGLVCATDFKGYADNIFLIMPDGGAWSGIYVYACGNTTLNVGDEIEITANVAEYYGLTELTNTTAITVLSSGNPLPPAEVISTAQLAAEEAWESVLVEVQNVVVTSAQNSYGEWYVSDASATPSQMDDGFFYLNSVTPPIVITVGDTWAILRGMTSYSYDEFELNPRSPDDMIATLPLVPDFIGDPLSGIVPLQVDFTDLSTGTITNWEWDFDNDGSIDSNEQNPTWIYEEVGVYTVSLTISDGTTSETEVKVDYITAEISVVADFEAEPLSGLAPLEVQFTDLSTGAITNWEWDFDNDGAIDSFEENPVFTYNTAGDYTVSLTVSDDYCTATETKIDYISVGEEIIADFSADPVYGLAPLEVQFLDSSVGAIISWEWDFDNDGSIDSNEQDPSYIYNTAGLYTVVLTVSDGTYIDTETKVDFIEVTEVGTGENLLPKITSLSQNYPNPFNPSTKISFTIQEGKTAELQIFNMKGQMIVSDNFNSGEHDFHWNAEALSSGVYFYTLQTDDFCETRKMILLK